MIRLTSFMNESPIYVPTDVVIKENYEHEFGMNYAMPTAKYKPLGGAMVVYDGIEYAVKESQEEVARKVLEWRLAMEDYLQGTAMVRKQAKEKLFELAGLEEKGRDE